MQMMWHRRMLVGQGERFLSFPAEAGTQLRCGSGEGKDLACQRPRHWTPAFAGEEAAGATDGV